jgi:hypothetical protein
VTGQGNFFDQASDSCPECGHSLAARHIGGSGVKVKVCIYPGCDCGKKPLSDPTEPKAKVARGAKATSRAAALRILPRTGTQRWNILMTIKTRPRTDEELAGLLRMSLNSVRPRRGELVDGEWIEDSGETRQTAAGNDAVVWKLSARGELKLKEAT